MFVQTSRHEGFCLPPLEAMAAGAPVVCTDAHGNRDFCVRRRELPDGGARSGRRRRRASSACSATPRCARGSWRAGWRPWASTRGSGASTRWRSSSRRVADQERARPERRGARAARRPCVRPPPSCCAARAAGPTRSLTLARDAERRARGARGRAHVLRTCGGGVRGARRDHATCCTTRRSSWPARPPGSSASPRRCAPTAGTASASSPCPTRTRATGTASARRSTSCSATRRFEPGAAAGGRGLEHLLGQQHLRPPGPRGDRPRHRHAPRCRG